MKLTELVSKESVSRELTDHRRLASIASGGAGIEPVYAAFLRLILTNDLRGTVLDFGAGVGILTERIWRLGRFTTLTGADLMTRPAGMPADVRWNSCDLNESTPFSSAAFDVILAPEIIEHLENPRAVARECFRLLRPGGTLALSTPNNESWRALIALVFRGHFVSFGDASYPAHITALLRRDIARILHEAGFTPPRFSFTDRGSLPMFTGITWQALSAGILRGLRYSDNLLAVAAKPLRTS
jgi:2-polyprenyl-3-methyl-5-hydroxy-6-metoxy-1,4-benzoquinol methylase